MEYSEYCFFLFSDEFKQRVANALVNMPYLFFTETTSGSGEYTNRGCFLGNNSGCIKCIITGNDNTTKQFRLDIGFISGYVPMEAFVVNLKDFLFQNGIEWTYTDFDDCTNSWTR